MKGLTHLSLFSGIGGLDLAAEWAGIQTIGQCEWAEYPTKVLERHWPDVPRWKDIRTLTGESFYERTGRRTVDIISGGFPCQPFSVAGKQRGKEDNRYLWPEMVRIIKELRPTWVVGENVTGIIRMALPDILSELEACGYRTRTFHIPASGVGARHHRYRVAIVGYSEYNGSSSTEIAGSTQKASRGQQERKKEAGESEGTGESRHSKSVGRDAHVEDPSCRRFGKQGNVCEQPGRTESERAGEVVANTESKLEGRLPVRAEQEKPGFIGGGEDVQHADSAGCEEQHIAEKSDKERFSGWRCDEGDVCNTSGQRLPDGASEPMERQRTQEPEPKRSDSNASDTDDGLRKWSHKEIQTRGNTTYGSSAREWKRTAKSVLGGVANGISTGMDGGLDFLINYYWDEEPDIPRIATGIEYRVDKLKSLGNAVVPQQFYPVFRAISEVELQNKRKESGDAYIKILWIQ